MRVGYYHCPSRSVPQAYQESGVATQKPLLETLQMTGSTGTIISVTDTAVVRDRMRRGAERGEIIQAHKFVCDYLPAMVAYVNGASVYAASGSATSSGTWRLPSSGVPPPLQGVVQMDVDFLQTQDIDDGLLLLRQALEDCKYTIPSCGSIKDNLSVGCGQVDVGTGAAVGLRQHVPRHDGNGMVVVVVVAVAVGVNTGAGTNICTV